MLFNTKSVLLATVAAVALGHAGAAFAQGATQNTAPEAQATAADNAEVVVTGRSGTGKRRKSDTSYSITTINEEDLRLQAPTSVTEALKSVPGFWVEASGGEASGNVRARGVPSYGVAGLFSKASDSYAHGLNERVPVDAIAPALAHWDSLLRDLSK